MSACCYLVLLQVREPFSIMSVVKSPMGLMVGFMLIVVFLMPKLMENMGMFLIIYLLTFFNFSVSFCLYGCICFVWVKCFISFRRSLGLILSHTRYYCCLATSKYKNQVEISDVPYIFFIFLPVSILE